MKFAESNYLDRYRFIVFDRVGTHPEAVPFSNIICTYAGDFSDSDLIERILTENRVDMVFHCISTTVPASSFNARYDIESNLIPSVALLDCMIRHKVYDILYISSGGAIYGTAGRVGHKEDDDVFPISSYGVVKLAIEKYMMQCSQLYGLKPLIVRLSNPYGPWHYSMKQGICNVALASALRGLDFSVWGDGNGTKDYIFVEDFCDILYKLVNNGVQGEVVNVGSGECKSVNDILSSVKALVPSFKWNYSDASELDVSRFELNTDKLRGMIGEYGFTHMDEGLRKTFEWEKGIC